MHLLVFFNDTATTEIYTLSLRDALPISRFRTTLVTAQIALSMALLIAAGLFLKSLVNVSRVDLGLRVENVVTLGLSPELDRKSTRLNSSHANISYAVFCLKKKKSK